MWEDAVTRDIHNNRDSEMLNTNTLFIHQTDAISELLINFLLDALNNLKNIYFTII